MLLGFFGTVVWIVKDLPLVRDEPSAVVERVDTEEKFAAPVWDPSEHPQFDRGGFSPAYFQRLFMGFFNLRSV